MAGAGYRLFNTGDVLTAAQVNTYLMQQSVMVFASAAARTTAISGVLAEGMITYLQDTNSLEFYDGSGWVAAVGDVTGITASSPLTGGGSSGAITVGIQDATTSVKGAVQLSDSTSTTSSVLAATPTAVKAAYDKASTAATTSVAGIVQLSDSTSTTSSVLASTPTATKSAYDLAASAIPKSTVTTAGDVIYATGSSAVTRLGIGTVGQVLTVNSGATAPEWATPPPPRAVNLLLNSNFAINQRTYVSVANLASGAYGFDRWKSNFTNTTLTFTASTQGQSLTINSGGGLQQVIEQGLVPAETYTLSWTGTATGRVYNSGATPPSYAASPVTFTADGSANVVVEFTASGGTKTLSKVEFNAGTGVTWALATPTLQTELAACQRYYYRVTPGGDGYSFGGIGFASSTTAAQFNFLTKVTMRATPTTLDYNKVGLVYPGQSEPVSSLVISFRTNNQAIVLEATTAANLVAARYYFVQQYGSGTDGFIGLSAEL